MLSMIKSCLCVGKLYTFGGKLPRRHGNRVITPSVVAFDLEKGELHDLGDMPVTVGCTTVATSADRCVIIGGVLHDEARSQYCFEYNPGTKG